MLRKVLIRILLSIGVIYLFNAAILFFFQPVDVQSGTASITKAQEFGGFKVLTVPNLRSGGIGGWSAEAGGYVDMLSPDETAYVNPHIAGDNLTQTSYLYRHEFTHVLQKRLVAKVSGGYPSAWNPIQSTIYYVNLIRLNNDLEKLMPKVNNHQQVIAKGLESAAECYAQPYSSQHEPTLYYKAPYIFPHYCNAEQVTIASRLFSGKWPKPLTKEEKAKLTPVNVTTVDPKETERKQQEQFMKTMKQLVGTAQDLAESAKKQK
jgi:hypothetical protein